MAMLKWSAAIVWLFLGPWAEFVNSKQQSKVLLLVAPGGARNGGTDNLISA